MNAVCIHRPIVNTIDCHARDVPVNRLFRDAEGELWCMRVRPRISLDDVGMCENVSDRSFWNIAGDKLVILVQEEGELK